MMMPDELAFELDSFDVAVVQLADHSRMPVVGKTSEFLGEIDSLHIHAPSNSKSLQLVYYLTYRVQNTPRGFRLARFRIHAQQILRPRRAYHHPTGFTDVYLDSIHILAAHHRKIEQSLQSAVRKVLDGLFLLPNLQVEINSAVVVFAEFRVQRGQ